MHKYSESKSYLLQSSIWICAVLFLSLSLAFSQEDASFEDVNLSELQDKLLETLEGGNVFLRLNQIDEVSHIDYIYYLHPIIPFVDKEGTVFVPFIGFMELLGSDDLLFVPEYNATSVYRDKVLIVGRQRNSIEMLDRNGTPKSIPLEDKVIWLDAFEDVLVPLPFVMQLLEFDYIWDSQLRIFDIFAADAIVDPSLLNYYYLRTYPSGHTFSILPKSIELRFSESGGRYIELVLREWGDVQIIDKALNVGLASNNFIVFSLSPPLPSPSKESFCSRTSEHEFLCRITDGERTLLKFVIGNIRVQDFTVE